MKKLRYGLILGLLGLLALPAFADDDRSYGYVRTLEGSGVLAAADTAERVTLMPNYPLEVGDEVTTDPQSRLELVLPDNTLLRLAGNTRVTLAELAYSEGSNDLRTVLGLDTGELQLEVGQYALGDQLPTIHTANATVYIVEPGLYRLRASTSGETQLLTREGYAEVATSRGSAIVRSGEEVVVQGGEWPVVSVLEAGYPDDLEIWADNLSAAAAANPSADEVDPALAYSAASLDGYGQWVDVGGERAWRPDVEVSWRPYTQGTWVPRAAGLTWVSYEPWGWVTAHYGYWSLDAGFGWLWYPGYVYSPAWVYWYWGPEWVGWVPVGFYGAPYYSPFYGYAGGYWGYYSNWTFCQRGYFGHPGGYHHYYPGREMQGRTGRIAVPRGLITNETGGIDRAVWRDPGQVTDVLERRARDARSGGPPDVTDFIAGRSHVPAGAVRETAVDRTRSDSVLPSRDRSGDRVAGRATDRTSVRRAPADRLSHQAWRDDGTGRVVTIRPRDEVAGDRAWTGSTRDATSASRLQQAWRSRYESSDRYRVWQGRSLDFRDRGDAASGYRSPTGDWRGTSLPPARRVIDGIRTGSGSDTRDRGASGRTDSGRTHRSLPPATSRRDTSSGSRGRDGATQSRGSRSDSGRTATRGRDSGGSRSHGGDSRSRSGGGSSRGRGSDGSGSHSRGRSGDHD